MKAAFLKKINEPLEVTDVDIPDPGDNEVLVKQGETGVCYRDLLTATGFFPRVKLPIIPGHEIGGTVVKAGKDVKNFKVGDRVSSLIYVPCGKCEYCLSGNENLCPYKESFGETRMGAYREYVTVPEISLVRAPGNVDDSSLALAACVTGMLYHAMVKLGKINEKSTVLVTGAGGGVGSHAVQMAKAFGSKVIAETTSESKKEMLYRIGADVVVDGNTNFNEKVKSEGGSDIVLEAVGIHTFERSLRSLKIGGKMIVIGNVTPEPVNLPLGLIILKGNTIRGSISSTKEDVKSALDMVSKGKIKPIIYKKVPIDDANDALEYLKNGQTLGRTMIKF